MSCRQVREMFSAYLDGAISGREMQTLSAHLESCNACGSEFEAWRGVQQALGTVGPVKAPEDLGLRLRVAISNEAARREGRWWNGITMRWDNVLKPMLLQASAGFAGSVVLVGSLALLIGVVAAPLPVQAHDVTLGALTAPHYLYSSAHLEPVLPLDGTIVIQADVNSAGRVYDYKIISGPTDAATNAQVRDHLMLQVYEPARAFGEPVRGQVLVTFSGVSVRG
jgi:hypothetical protein